MKPPRDPVLWQALRGPVIIGVALLGLLGVNLLMGALRPHGRLWPAELSVVAVMAAITVLFSMEAVHQPALVRLFSMLGFVWVGVLFGMTMLDYLGR